MLQEPAGAGLPLHAPPVHQVAAQPHPRVVVQPAQLLQLTREAIHAGQAGAGLGQIGGQLRAVAGCGEAGLERFAVVPDAIAQAAPEALPVVAPAQFVDQLAGDPLALGPALGCGVISMGIEPGEHGIAHLRQRQHPVADPGGEAGDGPIQVVAARAVAGRIDRRQGRFGRGAAAMETGWGRILRLHSGARRRSSPCFSICAARRPW